MPSDEWVRDVTSRCPDTREGKVARDATRAFQDERNRMQINIGAHGVESWSVSSLSTAVVEVRGVAKSFGAVQALRGVDLDIAAGEVLALVGDNGAGKSTLVKILSGVVPPDDGEIRIDGVPVQLQNPGDAQQHGISTVYQDLALVDVRTVAANVFLGREPRRWRVFVDFSKMHAESRAVLDRLRINIPSVTALVRQLSGGQRQAIAIARTLVRDSRVLLLDEPAAALGVEQTEHVSQLIADLRGAGKGVVLVSHNLDHVFRVADRVAVLRLGRIVAVRRCSEASREEIVGLITGAISPDEPSTPRREAAE